MIAPLTLLAALALSGAFAAEPAAAVREPVYTYAVENLSDKALKDSAAQHADKRAEMIEAIANYDPARPFTNGRVLTAMQEIPRHLFIPKELEGSAYDDAPQPIGEGQTVSQPYIVAFMTHAAEPMPGDKVLEVGTGSGYQAAVLSRLVGSVYSIEILPSLAGRAEKTLKRLGFKNVHVLAGDGYRGWPKAAPFDAILVTCAPDHIPQPLIDQLKEGGRMVIPVGSEKGGLWFAQELVLLRKTKDGVKREKTLDVSFVPMAGEAQIKPKPAKQP
jgi:protein-L-isoaspartate(D-aspartate) O-methyltransferase